MEGQQIEMALFRRDADRIAKKKNKLEELRKTKVKKEARGKAEAS